jgi:ATP-dependent Clp protease ATP-binding subunit ClpB
MQLEIEREALKKEKDDASKERLAELEKELADLQGAERRTDRAAGRPSATPSPQVQGIKEQIDQVRVEIEQAERAYDLQKAAELRYGKLRQPGKHELAQAQAHGAPVAGEGRAAQGRGRQRGDRRGREQVDGHPGLQAAGGRAEKLVRMEGRLHERVVGQEEAVQRGGRGHPPQPRRPARPEPAHRQLHLPGADGRGQDRTGAALAEFLFDDERAWCAST